MTMLLTGPQKFYFKEISLSLVGGDSNDMWFRGAGIDLKPGENCVRLICEVCSGKDHCIGLRPLPRLFTENFCARPLCRRNYSHGCWQPSFFLQPIKREQEACFSNC